MRDAPVEIARFYYRHEAEFARLPLEAAGIPSMIRADDAGGFEVALSFSNSVRLVVREQDAERARAILAEVEEWDEDEEEDEHSAGAEGAEPNTWDSGSG
jgi:hypothetical protein